MRTDEHEHGDGSCPAFPVMGVRAVTPGKLVENTGANRWCGALGGKSTQFKQLAV